MNEQCVIIGETLRGQEKEEVVYREMHIRHLSKIESVSGGIIWMVKQCVTLRVRDGSKSDEIPRVLSPLGQRKEKDSFFFLILGRNF